MCWGSLTWTTPPPPGPPGDFLARAEKAGQVVAVGEDLPKSFLLCRDRKGKVTVYLSQLSTATLLKRGGLGAPLSL